LEHVRKSYLRPVLILSPCPNLANKSTGNLDPRNRDIILNMLQENQKCRCVLLISHDRAIAPQVKTKCPFRAESHSEHCLPKALITK